MMSQRPLSLTNAKKSHEQFALKFLGATVHKVPRDLVMNYLQSILSCHVYVIDLSLTLSVFLSILFSPQNQK